MQPEIFMMVFAVQITESERGVVYATYTSGNNLQDPDDH